VVRAHPTVPRLKLIALAGAFSSRRPGVRPCLPSPAHSPTIRQTKRFGGIHVGNPVGEVRVRLDAGNGVCGFDAACGGPSLHPGRRASLQQRCVPALRPRNSRRRPRHGLHDPQQIAAVAGLPGIFPGACARGDTGSCGAAAEHQAGIVAKAGQRQAAQAEETGKARRDLSRRSQASISGR
jgi:hypothetical protein